MYAEFFDHKLSFPAKNPFENLKSFITKSPKPALKM